MIDLDKITLMKDPQGDLIVEKDKIIATEYGVSLKLSAYNRLKEILQDEANINSGKKLILGLTKGGCSGLSYSLYFEEENNLSFEKIVLFKKLGVPLIVSNSDQYEDKNGDFHSDLNYLDGVHIKFNHSLMSSGFVFDNTSEKIMRKCSCGISFKPENFTGKGIKCTPA